MRDPRDTAPTSGDKRIAEAVAFLRKWLPDEAKHAYRRIINGNPTGWWLDPHFCGGIIPQHALRGNGIDERSLGVRDLDSIWPDLLLAALNDGCEPTR